MPEVVCKVSGWRILTGQSMLHGQIHQLKLTMIEMFTENSQYYTMWEIIDILKNIQVKC